MVKAITVFHSNGSCISVVNVVILFPLYSLCIAIFVKHFVKLGPVWINVLYKCELEFSILLGGKMNLTALYLSEKCGLLCFKAKTIKCYNIWAWSWEVLSICNFLWSSWESWLLGPCQDQAKPETDTHWQSRKRHVHFYHSLNTVMPLIHSVFHGVSVCALSVHLTHYVALVKTITLSLPQLPHP